MATPNSIESIEVRHSPVTRWESFHHEFNRDELEVTQLSIRDIGHFYEARFTLINPSALEAVEWLNLGPMREVRFFNRRSLIDWEGFIASVRLSDGKGEAINNIDNMNNVVWCRYRDTSSGNPERSNTYQHDGSIARFGEKQAVFNIGQTSATNANIFAQQILDYSFWATPKISRIDLSAVHRGNLMLEFHCLGWWHTLNWMVYNQTINTGTDTASNLIRLINTECGQFIARTKIDTNSTRHQEEYDADRGGGEIMKGIAEYGDSNNLPWIVGVDVGRELFFKQAAPATVQAI